MRLKAVAAAVCAACSGAYRTMRTELPICLRRNSNRCSAPVDAVVAEVKRSTASRRVADSVGSRPLRDRLNILIDLLLDRLGKQSPVSYSVERATRSPILKQSEYHHWLLGALGSVLRQAFSSTWAGTVHLRVSMSSRKEPPKIDGWGPDVPSVSPWSTWAYLLRPNSATFAQHVKQTPGVGQLLSHLVCASTAI